MKDYRTWWRKDIEIWKKFTHHSNIPYFENPLPCSDDWDLIAEQLWAEREKLT